tara:strand:- start:1313 stop:2071 length:759 start_codon:yes stop_codon:yes gene_type:complete
MKKLILYIFLAILFSCDQPNNRDKISSNQNTQINNIPFKLEIGDILFQDLDDSPLCDAIELVTPGYNGANFSHIGIITSIGDPFVQNMNLPDCVDPNYDLLSGTKVLEAIPGGVRITLIDSFLNRSHDENKKPKVIVGRLKPKYKHSINNAIKFLEDKIGREYDQSFILNNNQYYCSELIYEAFKKDSIFELRPMTFLHPETKDTLPVWIDYYKDLGITIPEKKLGINPGTMSLSKKIDIVHFYGKPYGIKE